MDGLLLEKIRSMLLNRQTRMGHESVAQQIDGEPDGSSELIDLAQALEQIGRDTSLKEAERRELLAIEKALSKMSTGEFGICEDCGDDIPSKRLMVLPEARLCAGCQSFEERQSTKITRTRAAS
jgi:DnaK suppressor protein